LIQILIKYSKWNIVYLTNTRIMLSDINECFNKDINNELSNDLNIKKLKRTLINQNKYLRHITPSYCQTCNIKLNKTHVESCEDIISSDDYKQQYNSFCSEECFNFASQKHCGGAILPIQMYKGEPCFIMIKDGTREENVSELAGGKKQIYEGGGKTSAREGTEELGLKKIISYHYLENYGIRLLLWFNKQQNMDNYNWKDFDPEKKNEILDNYINYTVYIISIENFDIEIANLAAKSRRKDIKIKNEWKETQKIFMVPIKNLENYSSNKTDCIYDYKGDKIPPISYRWKEFLKNKNTIKIMKDLIFSKVEPWKVRIKNKSHNESFVWSYKDLITTNNTK
jgi:hypothetical protein